MNQQRTVLPIDYDEIEREALTAAVAYARADARPGVPHERVRAELMREIERLRTAASSASHKGSPYPVAGLGCEERSKIGAVE